MSTRDDLRAQLARDYRDAVKWRDDWRKRCLLAERYLREHPETMAKYMKERDEETT